MKTRKSSLLILLSFLFFSVMQLNAQNVARVQVIHNSADAAASVVDVWLDNTLLIDNFAFRTATPFVDAPAGTSFTIAIKDQNSTNPNNPVWSKAYTLAEGSTYILVADGIVSPEGYNPVKPFDISVYAMGRESALMSDKTDVLVHHGSTDAPVVDIFETGIGAGKIIDNFMYSDFAGYLELSTLNYILEVRDETGTATVASYQSPLATLGLGGAAITVLASGFLNPANNSNGPAFGLYVALATGGDLVMLPVYQPSARVQVIHNSADAAASVVDVWLDNTLLIDNFAFRTATPFIDAPAGTPFTIAIKDQNSTNPNNPVWSKAYTLSEGSTYILVADGIVSPEGYNPIKPFDISVYDMGRESALMSDKTDVLVHHGSTDAPVVDIFETGIGAGKIIDNFMYSDFAGYLELSTLNYIIEVRDETGTVTVASYQAPLATLGLNGVALTVVASGFLNPSANSNGSAFGLYVALPAGGDLVMLPSYSPPGVARVQVIHNSPDAAAAIVDVWADDELLIDNFNFRSATPFIDVVAGIPISLAVQPSNSSSPANPLYSVTVNLEDGKKYVVIANGLVSSTGYEPNQPFNLYIYDMARETASSQSNTDVLVFHGSTDAPTVDIYEVGQGAGLIINNLDYTEYNGYLELPNDDYTLQIRDESGANVVATFGAPLESLGLSGMALTVLASGFLNPSNNSNGAAFGLYAALANGGNLVPLTNTSNISENESSITGLAIGPIPTNNKINIAFNLENPSPIKIELIDLLGNVIHTDDLGFRSDLVNETINVESVSEGLYMLRISYGDQQSTRKVVIN